MSLNVAVLNQNNKVINIIIVNDNYELNANEIVYTNNNPAYIGGDYIAGYFYPEQPFASWVRVEGNWNPPTPMPTEGLWRWDEPTLTWIESTFP